MTFLLLNLHVQAQCSGGISSFPYVQDFEASNGGWTPGGTNADWSWGTPLKAVINSAASGTKCWITGGLTQSAYTNAQNSTLTSPCFNFSGLSQPYIKMKIFWETEKKYDGASFQYSIDGGSSWTTLGSAADLTSCPANNWFNTTVVTALGADGWSGNIQPTAPCTGGAGNGSGAWKLAQREMFALAGKSNVRFRFRFGSGSVCNNYDGFAVDDIWIGEAPPASATIGYNCTNATTVSFTGNVSACNASYNWNFGDPASGAANTSGLQNPAHVFSGAGMYTVSLTVSGTGIVTQTVTQTIRIIETNVSIDQAILCNGDKNGAIHVQVNPAGNYAYSWNTSPAQTTASINGLGAGSYTVTVTGNNVCTASDFVTLNQPAALSHQRSYTDALCDRPNGSVAVQMNGGTAPYQYQWTPNVSNAAIANNLPAGNYLLNIRDANGCTDTASFNILNRKDLQVSLGKDTVICPGPLVLQPGNYASYQWQDGSSASSYTVQQSGWYAVTVSDAAGCTATDSIKVTIDCSDIYFPNAFSPDKDGRNETFRVLGNTASLRNYTLRVYDRWGGIVYSTTDPAQGWNGMFNNKPLPSGHYIWQSSYNLTNRSGTQYRKGSLLLVR